MEVSLLSDLHLLFDVCSDGGVGGRGVTRGDTDIERLRTSKDLRQ